MEDPENLDTLHRFDELIRALAVVAWAKIKVDPKPSDGHKIAKREFGQRISIRRYGWCYTNSGRADSPMSPKFRDDVQERPVSCSQGHEPCTIAQLRG